jgi:hypothetical protein
MPGKEAHRVAAIIGDRASHRGVRAPPRGNDVWHPRGTGAWSRRLRRPTGVIDGTEGILAAADRRHTAERRARIAV